MENGLEMSGCQEQGTFLPNFDMYNKDILGHFQNSLHPGACSPSLDY